MAIKHLRDEQKKCKCLVSMDKYDHAVDGIPKRIRILYKMKNYVRCKWLQSMCLTLSCK